MSLKDLAAAPGGEKLSMGLEKIDAGGASLIPDQVNEEVIGMVVFSSPRTLDPSPQYRRALNTITRYAALALSK